MTSIEHNHDFATLEDEGERIYVRVDDIVEVFEGVTKDAARESLEGYVVLRHGTAPLKITPKQLKQLKRQMGII